MNFLLQSMVEPWIHSELSLSHEPFRQFDFLQNFYLSEDHFWLGSGIETAEALGDYSLPLFSDLFFLQSYRNMQAPLCRLFFFVNFYLPYF